MSLPPGTLAALVVPWQRIHGRNTLPWQNTRDPYRVWLSEVMLQQTQVATVLGYYDRFLERFPTVTDLAAASLDEVLSLWSGLGYYSRARNLYACAQAVVARFGGTFPVQASVLETLPGIGRSTAAAIASFCFGEQVAILDANVRRVLTRALGFDHDLASATNERTLWALATEQLPAGEGAAEAMPRYTQGMMDIGATVCVPRKPACLLCPLATLCEARQAGDPERYPVKTRKLKRSAETWWLVVARDPVGRVRLVRRAATGIWAGLFSLPVYDSLQALLRDVPAGQGHEELDMFLHALTHKDLYLRPVLVHESEEASGSPWFAPQEWENLGLPSPIRKLLARVAALPVGGVPATRRVPDGVST